jgi:hypothetical protein
MMLYRRLFIGDQETDLSWGGEARYLLEELNAS